MFGGLAGRHAWRRYNTGRHIFWVLAAAALEEAILDAISDSGQGVAWRSESSPARLQLGGLANLDHSIPRVFGSLSNLYLSTIPTSYSDMVPLAEYKPTHLIACSDGQWEILASNESRRRRHLQRGTGGGLDRSIPLPGAWSQKHSGKKRSSNRDTRDCFMAAISALGSYYRVVVRIAGRSAAL